MVIDSVAEMAKIANTSVSMGIQSSYETWIGYMIHFLNNVKKQCIDSCNRDSVMQFVASDFRAMKIIAEDSNRRG